MLNWRERVIKRMLILGDVTFIFLSMVVVSIFDGELLNTDLEFMLLEFVGICVFILFNHMILVKLFKIYDYIIYNCGKVDFRVFYSSVLMPVISTLMAMIELELLNESINMQVYKDYTLVLMAITLISRLIISAVYTRNKVENIVLIGYANVGQHYIYEILKRRHLQVNVIGYIRFDEDPEDGYRQLKCLGTIDDWEKIVSEHVVDQVTMVPHHFVKKSMNHYIRQFESRGIVFNVLLDFEGSDTYHVSEEMIGPLTSVKIHAVSLDETQLFVKKVMDIFIGLIGLVFFCILYIILGPLIKLDSKGPVIFKQDRVGRNGRIFKIWKFRTMSNDAESRKKDMMKDNKMDRNMFKMTNDPRITRLGKILRKTSLDEFPQFINVLKGDMSIVGTRPPTLDEVASYTNEEHRRIAVFPGITGIWQTSGRSTITSFDEIFKIESEYISNWSVWLDLKILLKTVLVVIKCEGSE